MTAEPASKPSTELPQRTSPTVEFAGLKRQYAELKPAIDTAIQRVLDHGKFIMGPEIGQLEDALAEFAGCRHAIAVSSGTDALLMALMAEDIGPDDAVFLPGFTFTASAEVIALLGATPVFVDVNDRNFNIDPVDLERRISEVRRAGTARPRVVMAVDLFGLPADYAVLNDICERENLFLLADAAQSFGASLGNRRVGTLAPVTATSFFPAKPLGGYGDGGALFTDDDERADLFRSIRLHGRGTEKYDIARLGLNARLDTIQAAILLAKLSAFESELEAREALALRYDAAFANLVPVPERQPDRTSTWAQYTVQLDERDKVAESLAAQGVPTAVYYPRPLHLQPAYMPYGDGPDTLPVCEALCGRVLSLPMHGYMGLEAADKILRALSNALAGDA